ncbi:MAG: Na/Pi cotransporter family protein [Bacillota bacterium]|nr:Na/Pi cotransporter family protein [Bacillota bacterium]
MFSILLGLLGGLAIVLHGLRYCSEGLQKSAGNRLKTLLRRLTKSQVRAAAVGAVFSALVQSSTAVTVMLVGLAGAGLVSLSQAIGIILGADVGTTFAVQILAFDTGPWSLALVAAGYFLNATARRKIWGHLGQALSGLGLVFFGLRLIGQTVGALRNDPMLYHLLSAAVSNPYLALFGATLFTALVHSSAATLGFTVSLAAQGALTLFQALPMIAGANIGTCATALLSAAGSTTDARRVAVAHVSLKLLAVAFLWPLRAPFAALLERTAASVPRQIANAHTVLNLLLLLAGLPLSRPLAELIKRLIPERAADRDPAKPQYLDRLALETPALALEHVAQEIGRLGELVEQMVARIPAMLNTTNPLVIENLLRQEEAVDRLFGEINAYLGDIGQRFMGKGEMKTTIELLHVLSELEHAADAVVKIALLCRKCFDEALSFSDEGLRELSALHARVQRLFSSVLETFRSGRKPPPRSSSPDDGMEGQCGPDLAEETSTIALLERQLREVHLGRLQAGYKESRATSAIHLDILSMLRRLADHAASIAAATDASSSRGGHSLSRPVFVAPVPFEGGRSLPPEKEPSG